MSEEIISAEPSVPDTVGGVQKLDGWEKTAVELGPLVAFGIGYYLSDRVAPLADGLLGQEYFVLPGRELFMGLAAFLPAFALAFVWSVVRTRRVAPILAFSGAIVVVLAVLTFALGDDTFIYIKPTIYYALVAIGLTVGLLIQKNPLRLLFDGAFELPDVAWRTLTWRFVAFHAVAAVANEIAWRSLTGDCVSGQDCAGRDVWVNIKLFGFLAAYFVFIACQAPFLMKHMDEPKAA